MSEETVNPSVVVPASILLSLVINGTCGFAMIIAMQTWLYEYPNKALYEYA
jgi:amino acid transporter